MDALGTWMKRHPILLGLFLIFACTWAIDLTLAAQARGVLPEIIPWWVGLLVGYGFVIAALLATAIVEGRAGVRALLRRYLIWRTGLFWYAVVLLGPVAVCLLAIGLARMTGAPLPDFSQPFVRQVPGVDASLSLGLVALIWFLFEIFTNGEEIGWRGYLLPRLLARYNALLASLLLGIVWTLWHLPKFWMGGAAEDAHNYPFWLLGVHLMAQSILYTWVFLHTRGSLLLATLFHAANNTAYLCLPLGVAVPNGEVPFLISIGLYCLWALAVILATGVNLTDPRMLKPQPEPQGSA
jgi:membrane protease YdiL (CAAX protease family)